MKQIDFEEFLQEKHAEDYHGSDDEMPDAFNDWLVKLEVDDIISYANEWGRKTLAEQLAKEAA